MLTISFAILVLAGKSNARWAQGFVRASEWASPTVIATVGRLRESVRM